tara:strand:- start:743 stop:1267 length:525 start_codon:yes stop_codon:yes gene_type:complete
MQHGNFEQRLTEGKQGESYISNWFKQRGFNIIPIYEKEIHEGKGPTLFLSSGPELVAPDLLVFKENKIIWIEAKHKNAFSWYRNKGIWTTGIDQRHFNEYVKVSKLVQWPLWILFLHRGGLAKDTPGRFEESPRGLFGQDIKELIQCIDHKSMKWGSSGMVYWDKESLILLQEI